MLAIASRIKLGFFQSNQRCDKYNFTFCLHTGSVSRILTFEPNGTLTPAFGQTWLFSLSDLHRRRLRRTSIYITVYVF